MEQDNFEVNQSDHEVHHLTNDAEVVMQKKERKLMSPVWNHFVRVKINGEWKGICKDCKAQYVTNSNAGTNHMKRHLPKCPLLKQKTLDQYQQTLHKRKFSEDEANVEIYEFSQDVSRRKVAEMIILHEYPLNIVNHIGFREFIYSLQPEFRMVSRNTIKSDIMKIFDVEKMKTMQELWNIRSKIAITTDMWTAGPQKKGYMAVTAHYIDNLWNIRSRILRFVYVPCPHTSEVLAKRWNFGKHLKGTKYPTTIEFSHLVCEIKLSITQWLSCHVVEVREMATKMMDTFDKYWLVIHGVMAVATVLDSRFKMKLIEFYFAKIYGLEESLLEIAKIRGICEELFKEYEKSGLSETISSGSGTHSIVASDFPSVGSMTTNHLMGFQQYVSCTSINENKSELDLYFDESFEPCIGSFDILSWWKLKVGKYPTLSRIARDLLAVPVSTVASESVFNTGGRIVSSHRSRLIRKTLEALMCAQNWLWATREDFMKAREFPTLDDEDESEVSQIASSSASATASVHASKA